LVARAVSAYIGFECQNHSTHRARSSPEFGIKKSLAAAFEVQFATFEDKVAIPEHTEANMKTHETKLDTDLALAELKTDEEYAISYAEGKKSFMNTYFSTWYSRV